MSISSLVNNEVESAPEDYVVQANEEAWADALADRYRVEPPELHRDQIWRSKPQPIEVDVSRDSMRAITYKDQAFMVPGHRITVHIPFSGDRGVFSLQPSTYTLNPPVATVGDGELLHTIEYPDDRPVSPDPSTNELIQKVEEPYLRVARADIDAHNEQVRNHALACIRNRRQRIDATSAVLDQSAIPVGPPDEEKKRYIADVIERLPSPLPPSAPTERPIELHPALADEEYEQVASGSSLPHPLDGYSGIRTRSGVSVTEPSLAKVAVTGRPRDREDMWSCAYRFSSAASRARL